MRTTRTATRKLKSRPAPEQTTAAKLAARGLRHGRAEVRTELARRATLGKAAAAAPDKGVVVAEGDSWFDYPGADVLDRLEAAGFRVAKVAHAGDRLEDMAYHPKQVTDLVRVMRGLKEDGHTPRAIVLSGGGNDLAGEEFVTLLNHAASGLPALSPQLLDVIIGERLMFAYGCLIGRATQAAEEIFLGRIPVVIHGYGYPVPDGRGFWGGGWFLPGPWLKPGFCSKGHTDPQANADVMVKLIDRFNQMASTIPTLKGFEHVTWVDVRPVLSNELAGDRYQASWENELHPTEAGFEAVADKFLEALRALPEP